MHLPSTITFCCPAARPAVIWLCHGALLLAQASFVVGAVYFRAVMQQLPPDVANAVSPLKFVFCRCALATPILIGAAAAMTGTPGFCIDHTPPTTPLPLIM